MKFDDYSQNANLYRTLYYIVGWEVLNNPQSKPRVHIGSTHSVAHLFEVYPKHKNGIFGFPIK